MIPICAASKSHSGTSSSLNGKKKIDQRALSIDISDQQFRLLPPEVIAARGSLEHLIADGNGFNENILRIPLFPKLKTLTLNDNKIRDVGALLVHLSRSCPKLQYLSLVGNPGWPDLTDVRRYKKYRKVVTILLPNVKYLDGVLTNPKNIPPLPRNYSSSSSSSSIDSVSST